MKRFLLILTAIVCMTNVLAQDRPQRQGPRMSPEEYKAKQQEFISRRADLTEVEAAAFFPVYFQLQKEKMQLNGQLRHKMREMWKNQMTEEEAAVLVDEMADMKLKCDQLDKDYLQKFKTLIPATKLMKVQMAEEEFRRELLRDMERGGQGPRPQGDKAPEGRKR